MTSRTNEEWIAELRGDVGQERQYLAHLDLGTYLQKMAYNYLLQRQRHLEGLHHFSPGELATLATDFAQETLLKLSSANFKLLDQFQGRGLFTSWTKQIVMNEARQELRKSYWTRRGPMPVRSDHETNAEMGGDEYIADSTLIRSDQWVVNQEIGETLKKCIEQLSDDRRIAFQECQIDTRPAKEVAAAMGTSPNAIHILVYRAKQDLRRCLEQAGIGPNDLAIS